MQPFDSPFDIVVTTNSGYPLDQNLYQAVKGMSAGARLLRPGGTLILAAECRDGAPANSSFDQLLRSAASPEELLARLARLDTHMPEQWQAQIQALIQRRARVMLYSSVPDHVVRAVHLTPCHDIGVAVAELVRAQAGNARVAALPQGPLTIPYLSR
jgi:nickel-dependent lactate racemase